MSHFAIVGQGGILEPFLLHLNVATPLTILTHLFDRSDYEYMEKSEEAGRLIKVGEDPGDFLDSILTGDMAVVVRYEEVRDPSWATIWPYLRRQMPIVHVKRKNLLYTHVMRSRGKVPFYYDPEILERDLGELADARREHDIILQHGQVYDFWYEDDERYVLDLGDFLGREMKDWHVPPDLDIVPMIENYAELRRNFTARRLPCAEYFNG